LSSLAGRAADRLRMRQIGMGFNSESFALASPGGSPPRHPPVRRRHAEGWSAQVRDDAAAAAVTALYQSSALGLVRLATVLIGDRGVAEDIVQDAFSGLYWRWEQLRDQSKALPYVRSAVLNACRSTLRRAAPTELFTADLPDLSLALASAEAVVLSEEQ